MVGGTRRAPLIIKDTWRTEERFQSAISDRFPHNGRATARVGCPFSVRPQSKKDCGDAWDVTERETHALYKLGAFPHRKYAKLSHFNLPGWLQRHGDRGSVNGRCATCVWRHQTPCLQCLYQSWVANDVMLSVCFGGPSSSIWSL